MSESRVGQHQVLIDEQGLLESPKTWLTLLAVILLGLAGTLAYFWSEGQKQEQVQAALSSFIQAKTPEEKLVVARANVQSPESAAWLMEVGSAFYQAKKYPLAAEAYGLLVEKQGASPLAPGATLGQAEALLASGQGEEAAGLINRLLQLKVKNAYQPLGQLALARWQISENKTKEARQTLEDLLAQSPGSSFTPDASNLLASLPK